MEGSAYDKSSRLYHRVNSEIIGASERSTGSEDEERVKSGSMNITSYLRGAPEDGYINLEACRSVAEQQKLTSAALM